MAAVDEKHTPAHEALTPVHLPRITIRFCTQCKWMLRAAYVCKPVNLLGTDVHVCLFELCAFSYAIVIFPTVRDPAA